MSGTPGNVSFKRLKIRNLTNVSVSQVIFDLDYSLLKNLHEKQRFNLTPNFSLLLSTLSCMKVVHPIFLVIEPLGMTLKIKRLYDPLNPVQWMGKTLRLLLPCMSSFKGLPVSTGPYFIDEEIHHSKEVHPSTVSDVLVIRFCLPLVWKLSVYVLT